MKSCKCGCGWPVFSHGYSRYCQNKRTDDKKPKKIAPRTTKERVTTIDFGFDDQLSMFQALWENAKGKNGTVTCPYTKEPLNCFYNTELWVSCFAHVLPKGKYTYWKLNPINIRVVHPDFHLFIHEGVFSDRKLHPFWNYDLWDKEVEELKIQYQEFKKRNFLA